MKKNCKWIPLLFIILGIMLTLPLSTLAKSLDINTNFLSSFSNKNDLVQKNYATIKMPTKETRDALNIPNVFGSEIAPGTGWFAETLLPNDTDLIQQIKDSENGPIVNPNTPFIFKRSLNEGVFYPLIRLDYNNFILKNQIKKTKFVFTVNGPGKVDWSKVNFMNSKDIGGIEYGINLTQISENKYSYEIDSNVLKDNTFNDILVFGIKMTDLDFDIETSLRFDYYFYDDAGNDIIKGDNINAISYVDELLNINFTDPLILCVGDTPPNYKEDSDISLEYTSPWFKEEDHFYGKAEIFSIDDDEVDYDSPGTYKVKYSGISDTKQTTTTKEQTVIVSDNSIVINYVDDDEKTIMKSTDLGFAKKGSSFSVESPTFDGYQLKDSSQSVIKGSYTCDKQIITVKYSKVRNVFVQYLDEQGNSLAPTKTLNGFINDPYQTEALEFDGYQLIQVPDNADGKFAKDDITVTYRYKKNSEPVSIGKVIVKYVDDKGNDIAKPTENTGIVGSNYVTQPLIISGYTNILNSGNTSGVYTEEAITVIYTYKKDETLEPPSISYGKVRVLYIDIDGNQIAPSTVINGEVGTTYQTSPKEVSGYTLVDTPSNATGLFTSDTIDVYYTYKPDEGTTPPTAEYGTVTTWFVDEDDNVISQPETITGQVGDNYVTTAIDIPGYTLKTVPTNEGGQFINGNIDVIYVYEKNNTIQPSEENGTITIWFVDTEGNEISPSSVQTGVVGSEYQTSAIEITGYMLVNTPTNKVGQFVNGNIDVTYVYKKNESVTIPTITKGKVTTQFVDESGNKLSQSNLLYGNIGDTYQTSPIDIPGYRLVNIPNNKVGVFTEEDIFVTYVYKQNSSTVNNTDNNNEKPTNNDVNEQMTVQKTIQSATVSETIQTSKQKNLPKTGENYHAVSGFLGICLSLLSSSTIIIYHLKQKRG